MAATSPGEDLREDQQQKEAETRKVIVEGQFGVFSVMDEAEKKEFLIKIAGDNPTLVAKALGKALEERV